MRIERINSPISTASLQLIIIRQLLHTHLLPTPAVGDSTTQAKYYHISDLALGLLKSQEDVSYVARLTRNNS